MQKIHVRRYAQPCGWEGFIEPEDRSWIVFIDDDEGQPHLYKRVEYEDDDGTTQHDYVNVEHVSGLVPDVPGTPDAMVNGVDQLDIAGECGTSK